MVLEYLTHVSLKMTNFDFEVIEPIIKNLFDKIQILYLSMEMCTIYIDAKRWEELILSSMPNLRIFDVYNDNSGSFGTFNRHIKCEEIINLDKILWFC